MKCIRCGKKAVIESFCRECYEAAHPAVQGFKDIKVTLCAGCNKHFWKNKWIPYTNVDDVIKKIAMERIVLRDNLKRYSLSVLEDKYKHKLIELVTDRESYELPVTISREQCPVCSKVKSRYFEATLQVRTASQEILDYIRKEAERKSEKGISIVKEDKMKDGVDFLLSSKKFAISIGNKLLEKYGGIQKVNERLFSQSKQTSKLLYRVTVFFKPPHYLAGEVVIVSKNPVKITSTGKQIHGINLANGKKIVLSYDESHEVLPQHETMVTKVHPRLEVLHPDTFQSVESENAEDVEIGDTVRTVVFHNKLYIV